MALFCLGAHQLLQYIGLSGKLHSLLVLVTLIPGSIGLYAYCLYWQGFEELSLITDRFLKKLRAR